MSKNNGNTNAERIRIFLFIIVSIFFIVYFVSDLMKPDESYTDEMCQNTFDLMQNTNHAQLHEDYPETMNHLHLIIEQCHEEKKIDLGEDPNGMIGMKVK